jgi:hypothetical protein
MSGGPGKTGNDENVRPFEDEDGMTGPVVTGGATGGATSAVVGGIPMVLGAMGAPGTATSSPPYPNGGPPLPSTGEFHNTTGVAAPVGFGSAGRTPPYNPYSNSGRTTPNVEAKENSNINAENTKKAQGGAGGPSKGNKKRSRKTRRSQKRRKSRKSRKLNNRRR